LQNVERSIENIKEGRSDFYIYPGDSPANWNTCNITGAKKAGIKHYFIVDASSNVIGQVPESITSLKSLNELVS
jgi:hypothetical protein